MTMRTTGDLFIVCQRANCDGPGFRRVRRPWQQRVGGYCSRRCATLDHQPWLKSDRSAAGTRSGQIRQAHVLTTVQHLTPLDAFRLGYQRGLQSKHRQIRRLVEEIRHAQRQGAA